MAMDDMHADGSRPGGAPRRGWVWLLFLAAGIVVAAMAFWGYGQPEFLLEAVNLRYCG